MADKATSFKELRRAQDFAERARSHRNMIEDDVKIFESVLRLPVSEPRERNRQASPRRCGFVA